MEVCSGISLKTRDASSEWWEDLRKQVKLVRSVYFTSMPEGKLESDLRVIISDALEQYSPSVATCASQDAIAVISGKSNFLEAAFMWLGGWRPTSAIVLVLSLTNIESKKEPEAFPELHGHVPTLSERQLYRIKSLQAHTQQAEHDISHRLALLQMLFPDQSLISAITTKNWSKARVAVEEKIAYLKDLLVEADSLRLQTLHELHSVLSPVQAAKCIIAAFELGYAIKTLKGSVLKQNDSSVGSCSEVNLKGCEASPSQAEGILDCKGCSINKQEPFHRVGAAHDMFFNKGKPSEKIYEQLGGSKEGFKNEQNLLLCNHFAGTSSLEDEQSHRFLLGRRDGMAQGV